MARQTEIIMSLQDKISPSIDKIVNANNRLNKDLEHTNSTMSNLMKQQNAYRDNLVKEQGAVTALGNELKKAKKDYADLGDEQSKNKMDETQRKFNDAKENVSAYSAEIRNAQKEIRNLSDEQSKLTNRAGGEGSDGMMATLGKAGLGKMVGDSLANAGGSLVSSAFGNSAGTQIEGMLSSIATGAAIGSVIPGIGTIAGGGMGAIVGALDIATQEFQSLDDSFVQTRDNILTSVNTRMDENIKEGTGIFAQRQMVSKAFEGDLGKDGAKNFVETLVRKDTENPFTFDDMALLSRTYFGFGLEEEQIYKQLDNIGNLSAARGLDTQDMNMVAKTIAGLTTSPSVTKMDIEKLTTRGVPVLEYIGNAYGMASDEVFANLKSFNPNEIFEIINDGLSQDARFAGAMGRVGETYAGKLDMIEGAENNEKAAYGEGYTQERDKGLTQELAFKNTYAESSLEDARLIGEYEASLENRKEDINRQVMRAIKGEHYTKENLTGSNEEELKRLAFEYDEAKLQENGAKMGEIIKRAQAITEMEINATVGQEKMDSEALLHENITDMLVNDERFYNAYHRVGKLAGQGIMAGLIENYDLWEVVGDISKGGIVSSGKGKELITATAGVGGSNTWGGIGDILKSGAVSGVKASNNAFGLPYVPYDNFPINAHQGERLLTANEARQMDNSGSSPAININITGNSFSDESQIDYTMTQAVSQLKIALGIT